MESWIQDPRVLEQSWTALSTQRGIPWTLHDKIRSFISERDAASRARVDWGGRASTAPLRNGPPFHKKRGNPRKEVFAGAPAADGRHAPETQTREREAGAPPTLMRPDCTGSAAQGEVSEVVAAAPVPPYAPAAAAAGTVVQAFHEAERCHAAVGAYLSHRLTGPLGQGPKHLLFGPRAAAVRRRCGAGSKAAPGCGAPPRPQGH